MGFVSGKEAIEEAETLIEDAKECTSNIFLQFSFGGRASPKVGKKEPVAVVVVEEEPVGAEESMWVKLKGLLPASLQVLNA